MPDKRTAELRKMNNLTTGLGLGQGAHSMVNSQRTRNSKPLNLGPVTEEQKAKKLANLTTGLGLGRGAHHMALGQRTRDSRNRGHGDLALDQAYDITAELLIRQRGLCWVTGSELVINGYSDNLRSYSIDRLDDTKGYSVDNCRAVCIWVNTASSYSGHSKIQLWRHLSKAGPIETPNTDPNYQHLFTDDWNLARLIQEGVACGQKVRRATIDRAAKWSRFYDFPPIAPLSALTDDQVMGLIAG